MSHGDVRSGSVLTSSNPASGGVVINSQSKHGLNGMNFTVNRHTVTIGGRKTSISLEDEFWKGFRQIAAERRTTASRLAEKIKIGRRGNNLSSAIRVFVLKYQRR